MFFGFISASILAISASRVSLIAGTGGAGGSSGVGEGAVRGVVPGVALCGVGEAVGCCANNEIEIIPTNARTVMLTDDERITVRIIDNPISPKMFEDVTKIEWPDYFASRYGVTLVKVSVVRLSRSHRGRESEDRDGLSEFDRLCLL
jgi:hypothetical protein